MKKQYLLLIAICSFFMANAQDKGEFEYGFFAGVNVSNISTLDNEDASSSRVGLNVGAYGEYYFSDRWSVRANLNYDQKGWKDTFTIFDEMDSESFKTNFALNYLTVPVLANWHFAKNRNWYLNVGPYAGFLLNAEVTENGLDISDGFNGTDFGLAFGIGVKIPINKENQIFIEYGAQSGFSDIFEDNQGETVRNGRSSINIGFTF
ncbi:porin family protein [Dokdonia ponticola]|uniref:Porin family protein n=1 Tax=Dokdonia ponticola TaxID=2041041 RepID=A0ABV9HWQ5_9FLAO